MKIKRVVIFLIIILILISISIFYPYVEKGFTGKSIYSDSNEYQKEPAILTKVIDGDTIKVIINGKEETIRLLGINTPEKKMPYFKQAKDFLIVFENKSIELLRDKEDIDRYNRKLRYLFYNSRFINVEILEQGLATSFMIDDLYYKEKFILAENYARKNEIGIWKKSKEICASCITLIDLNPDIDYFIIKNNCDFSCDLTGWFVKDDANHFFYLVKINAYETKNYSSKQEIWNDNGDRFFLRDKDGYLVIYYEY